MQRWIGYRFLLVFLAMTWVLAACTSGEDAINPAGESDTTNIDAAKQMYETLLAGDMEGAFAVMAEDIRWVYYGGDGVIPFSGVYVGHEGVTRFFADYGSVAEPLGMELASFSSSGDVVFVTGVENSRVLSTDKVYAAPWVHVLKFAKGKIVSYEEYIDSARVAAAISSQEN